MECVFACERDAFARKTYETNFKPLAPRLFESSRFAEDVTLIDPASIPDFDVLCAGFPCQPFSQAGFKKGFEETRGTLFFNIAEILKTKRPPAFFLENVRYLLKHDNGKTFALIRRVLVEELGYSFHHRVVKASEFGLPQHRPRLFMVGFRENLPFEFPQPQEKRMTMSDIFGVPCEKEIGFTLRVGGRGSRIDDRRNWDSYEVNGKVIRLTPGQGLKMQGFPDDFELPVSETQAMKQLGNSVAVPAVKAVASAMFDALKSGDKR